MWVVQEEIPVALQLVPLDVEVFSTEEKAREYFKKEFANLEHYYDGPAYNWTMPGDEARETEEEIIEQMHYEAEDGTGGDDATTTDDFLLDGFYHPDQTFAIIDAYDCHM